MRVEDQRGSDVKGGSLPNFLAQGSQFVQFTS